MKTQFFSIVELAQDIERAAASKRDFIADTRNMEMTDDGNGVMLHEGGVDEAFTLTSHAHRQVSQRLSIPAKYYDRMRAEAPDLLKSNVDRWFHDAPERRMVRTMDGCARAFLSDRYQRIENEEIFQAVLPALREIPELEIRSLALTESNMHIKATVPTIKGEVKTGDIVEAGVSISNSEVGKGAVVVQPLVLRLVCLNGMKVNDSTYRAAHIGARADTSEGVYEMLSDETLKADDNAILLKTRDVVAASLSEEMFVKTLERMQASAEDRVEGDPVKAIETLAKKFDLTDTERGGVLSHLIEGADLSRWGVINAVTRAAQDLESYDRNDDFEAIGGKVLDLSRREWGEIAMAA